MKRTFAQFLTALFLCLSLSFCAPTTQQLPSPDPGYSARHGPRDEEARLTPEQSGTSHRYATPPKDVRPENTQPRNQEPELRREAARGDLAEDRSSAPDPTASAPASRPSKSDAAAEMEPRSLDEGSSGRALGSSGGAMAEKKAAQPQERPGLGTTWGETRYSSVSEVPFERDGGSPNYTAALHYDNERGARALAGGDRATNAVIGLGSALTVSLRNEYGGVLSAYRGNNRTVAVGENGQRYSIVVRNNTNERFEVVLSVDGLDVLDGRDAAFGKRGYLLDPYATIEIEGFRQSDDAVAAFRFGSVSNSYAAKTGSARNVGVIGAAAFGERGYVARLRAYQERLDAVRTTYVEAQRRIDADPFPGRYATPPLGVAR